MTYRRGLHRFAVLTAAATLLLIVAGGLVTSTQSGLSVPDWPETYGHFMFSYPLDGMVGGIFYEHSHRMIASVVGFLMLLLAFWVWRREERRWVRRLALAALAAVIAQGVLGGITVLYLLPTAVSVAHATLAQTFFAAVVALSLFTSRWWIERRIGSAIPGTTSGSPATIAVAACVMVWIQLVLGAVMRHTASGLAVPDFPTAYGGWFPSLSPEALRAYTQTLIDADIRIAADGPLTAGQVTIHLLHRYWGMLTGVVLLFSAYRISRPVTGQRGLGALIAAATATQITLGVLTVFSLKDVAVTTAHVAVGALLLGLSVLAALRAVRMHGLGNLALAGRVGEAAA